ncbi:hypothetical protein TREMEDRAFT_39135 [Tremella mesenterica DSM 1558]|uniref:uncharacterized protein n=1 Tax=Tremella mesenterica (strain ATCC 24925 / CBS 8224 / DSM 1558 / NBRC 9311 / NRRL Y-6157 / RJB 2259-6 / UBC 559-6) TaxID=578456 RepID=UPI0003F4A288|nr:uncharacterized protein TREMEDRAFT_39135 [Tremella mesenterica DSM 1558]EIW69564.1 hypothetical protein TREMEDRAFT_39135 [Tremella mesenterica DSM 1558]
MVLDFVLPEVHDNEDGSWGPSTSTLPAQFKDIPYAPFSKSDRITRIADWHEPAPEGAPGRRNYNTNTRRPGREAFGASEANAFGYIHDDDDKSFSLVDSGSRPSTRGRGMMRGGRGGRGFTIGRGRGGRGGVYPSRGGFGGRGRGRGGYGDWNKPQRIRDSSVMIGSEWRLLEEIDFTRLAKLNLSVDAPEDLGAHGTLMPYDKSYDRANTRNEKPLEVVDKLKYNISTSDDPIIADMSAKKVARIFATDSILAVLMCASRSVNSWDIILDRRGDQLFFDKRPNGPFDYITVNEHALDSLPEDDDDPSNINSPSSLSLEATYINQNFANQVIAEGKSWTPSPNPFYSPEEETEPLASCLYRYRKFDLSVAEDEEFEVVVRTEVDAYLDKKDHLITIKALNEFDPRVSSGAKALDWRKHLDTQRGAILATEIKNNNAKLARWSVQGILAGAEQMKMGYIARANTRDATRHVIVGVQSYKPRDFAGQMNISLSNGWGIVRTIADLALKQPEGKYVLVKDPNNPILRLYSVPQNAFDLIEEDTIPEEEEEEE